MQWRGDPPFSRSVREAIEGSDRSIPGYLEEVRGQPCLVCDAPGEPHHPLFYEEKSMSIKPHDLLVVPLCHSCHMDLHNWRDGEKGYWIQKGVDPGLYIERHVREKRNELQRRNHEQ